MLINVLRYLRLFSSTVVAKSFAPLLSMVLIVSPSPCLSKRWLGHAQDDEAWTSKDEMS